MASSTTNPVAMVSAISDEIVEAVTKQIHRRETADDRHRDGDRGNDGRARIADEQKYDEGHEDDRDDQGALGVLERRAYRRAAVGSGNDFDVARHRRLEFRQRRLDLIDRLDDVRPRLTIQGHENRRLALRDAGVAQIGDGIRDLGQIGEMHRIAVAIGDDQRQIVRGMARLIIGVDLIARAIALDIALGAVEPNA